ncbi:N-acetylmuramoyl-L-alanine amidase [Streptomyces tateyamensis]|uniref:N-acetylmuramoyl-L-alanine amidase n=1 Tax=Streptomyces tateyamensis TaxID=565073 RepID=A0A2V4NNT1_9ACTN|nr:N-acetylmuramoyl-L-alanine amidase [Streptomyces tateyamensis]PYC77621.1 N-acetylmuramoyl-L-alanine amidase [Streptomyces tateyamensis]
MRIHQVSLFGAACALALSLTAAGSTAVPAASAPARTSTLALVPLAGPRAAGTVLLGLPARATTGYSLLGVSWDDPAAELPGTVQVRTRSAGRWSGWQQLAADSEDRPDRPETSGARGATAPRWVGPSDGVQVRVVGDGPLPAGLRVDLVDPGDGPSAPAAPAAAEPAERALPAAAHQAPRPGIVVRAGWGADESLRRPGFDYTGDVRAVFVHHTDTGNDYRCSDSAKLIRSIYQYHVRSNGWRDLGYNFLVDRCGIIFEGRAGGVARSVLGAHTLGFNTGSAGVAALGTYVSGPVPQAQLDGIAKIAAWKLGLTGQDATGRTMLTSASNGSRYPSGTAHTFDAVSGHRDAFDTECPGNALFAELPAIRERAAHLQGRR